jgi:hypothetical protein
MLLNMILMAAGTIKIYICLEYTTYRKLKKAYTANQNIDVAIMTPKNVLLTIVLYVL